MRINIYSEELTDRVERAQKTANGRVFYGLRFFLESADSLHKSAGDDDSTAITFWADSPDKLRALFSNAEVEVNEPRREFWL